LKTKLKSFRFYTSCCSRTRYNVKK